MFGGYETIEAFEDDLYRDDSSSELSVDSEVEFQLYSQVHYAQSIHNANKEEGYEEKNCENSETVSSQPNQKNLIVLSDSEVIQLSDTSEVITLSDEDSIYRCKRKNIEVQAEEKTQSPATSHSNKVAQKCKRNNKKPKPEERPGVIREVMIIEVSSNEEEESTTSENENVESWMLLGSEEDGKDNDILLNLVGCETAGAEGMMIPSDLQGPGVLVDLPAVAQRREQEDLPLYRLPSARVVTKPSSHMGLVSSRHANAACELPEREEGEGEETPNFSHWGPPRIVEIFREPNVSLGISIVGGQTVIKRLKNGEELKGIFIKQVLEDSPAGKTNALKTGDKILEVSGVDLQNASHAEAVEAIKSAGNPVVFVVQSLSSTPRVIPTVNNKGKTPAPNQDQNTQERKAKRHGTAPPPMKLPPPYRAPSADMEGSEEDCALTDKKIRQRYADLPGELHIIELEKDKNGLGLSLAGNKDRSRMSIFVVGINPEGPAAADGRMRIGDELLEEPASIPLSQVEK